MVSRSFNESRIYYSVGGRDLAREWIVLANLIFITCSGRGMSSAWHRSRLGVFYCRLKVCFIVFLNIIRNLFLIVSEQKASWKQIAPYFMVDCANTFMRNFNVSGLCPYSFNMLIIFLYFLSLVSKYSICGSGERRWSKFIPRYLYYFT